MSCINPLPFRIKTLLGNFQNINVPCGHCLNCLIKKQSQIEFLAKKELRYNYQSGKSASFVTLTYDDNHIPYNENGFITLYRQDVKNFIKNMRRQIEYHGYDIKFKYLYCGEYGDGSHSSSVSGVSTCRPHYHIVFIGLSPEQAKAFTKKLWKNGLCDIGPLSAGGIRYLCKYMTKSSPDRDVKAFRKLCNVQNPFFYHSIGIGKEWIDDNLQKIVDDGFTFNVNGKVDLLPRYVMRYVSAHTGVNYLPYVKKFLLDSSDYQTHKDNYNEYKYEKDYLSYRYKVAALRSQGKPIDDFTMSKKWCHPYSSKDRSYKDLANLAYNSIIRIVDINQKNHKIPRDKVSNYDGSINWQKYFDICYVRENVPF